MSNEVNQRNFYLAAIGAFVIWGFFVIELRMLSAYSPLQILYFRVFASTIALWALVYVRKDIFFQNIVFYKTLTASQKRNLVIITFAGALFLTSNWFIFIYVNNNINVKTASFSYFICPVLTALFAFLIIKERLKPLQWLAVGICLLSCVLIGFQSSAELLFSIVIASTYALYLISQRRNLQFDRLLVLTVQITFSLIIMLPFYYVLRIEAPSEMGFYIHILFIAIVFTILPLFLNLYALKVLPSATLGIMMYLNPIIGFSIAFFYFKESTGIWQILGYIFIIIAIVVFNYEFLKSVFIEKSMVKGKRF